MTLYRMTVAGAFSTEDPIRSDVQKWDDVSAFAGIGGTGSATWDVGGGAVQRYWETPSGDVATLLGGFDGLWVLGAPGDGWGAGSLWHAQVVLDHCSAPPARWLVGSVRIAAPSG